MERILISGGNGFLGSHLADLCLMKGLDVTVVDDFSTSTGINLPSEVTLVRKKIEDYEDTTRFDYIAHLAARPSPDDYVENPVETILSNSLGTKKLLDMSQKHDSVFLYTSSSEVYGEAQIIPTPETYFGYVNPNGIRSCYDEGKRFSEALAMAYARQYNLRARIQRPFNVYGPRIRPDGQYGRVIPRFISQALEAKKITIHGDGKQTRSFLYVDDWIKATENMLFNDNLDGEVFNVGSSDQISIIDLAYKICSLVGVEPSVSYLPRREDDPTRRAADIRKAVRLLGWQPRVPIEEGLRKTIAWIKGEQS